MTVLADSGALFALMDRRDAWHGRVLAWFSSTREEVIVPVATLPEVTWMLARRVGAYAEARFIRDVADGHFVVEGLDPGDFARIADLVDVYADLPLGFTDASVVATAERLRATAVVTTDRRDFGVVRPAHCERLRLLP